MSRLEKWVRYQKTKMSELSQTFDQRHQQAELALAKSRRALRLAEDVNDPAAIKVARQAVRKSNQALKNLETGDIRSELHRETIRLEAVRKVIRLEPQWRKLSIYRPTKYGRDGADFPEEYGALMTASMGEISIETDKGRIPFDGSYPLQNGHRIFVGPDSYAELYIPYVGQFQMGPNSSIRIGGPTFTEKIQGFVHVEITCFKGLLDQKGLFGFTKEELDFCRRFKMGHRGVSIGVRGTELTMEAPRGEDLNLIVLEGQLLVTPAEGQKPVNVVAGEKMIIRSNGKVDKPIKVELKKIDKWWERTELWKN